MDSSLIPSSQKANRAEVSDALANHYTISFKFVEVEVSFMGNGSLNRGTVFDLNSLHSDHHFVFVRNPFSGGMSSSKIYSVSFFLIYPYVLHCERFK